MFPYTLKIINSEYITPYTKRFVVEKPNDFSYAPGQAALLSINNKEWKNITRPYSFTSLNDWPYLEFMIKIYEEGKGMSAQMPGLSAGDEFIMHEVFGTLKFKGPGIFIAGGTGVTPFIAIIRALYYSGNIQHNGLIYSVKTPDEIINGKEFKQMLGDNYIEIYTKHKVIGFNEKRIEKEFLIETISNFNQNFYLSGPKDFVIDLQRILVELGAEPEMIIF